MFGPLGDRYGRHKILAMTMILMAVGTFSIGLIPSYAQIGIGAPLMLLAARLVQGFSTGGEYGGAATFIAEYSTDRKRGLMGSWLEFGTLGGYIAGAGNRHRPADVAERDADARLGLAHSLPGRRAAGPARPLYAAEAGGRRRHSRPIANRSMRAKASGRGWEPCSASTGDSC
ncbi:MFS transporter [Sphingobium yanoikuyae]|uniref:MFS transporter n=1 Tax=Sphingobium yanoikuyae TaxID=13690 RepID=UPI00345EE5B1